MEEGSSVSSFLESVKNGKLLGYECGRCGSRMMGVLANCVKCGAGDVKVVELGREGRILTYSVQRLAPEPYLNDAPYAWVIVELDDGARATGWIPFIQRGEELKVGDRVRFVKSYRQGIVFEKI